MLGLKVFLKGLVKLTRESSKLKSHVIVVQAALLTKFLNTLRSRTRLQKYA